MEDEMGGTCNMHVGDEKSIQNFRWKTSRKRPHRRRRRKWEGNIKMNIKLVVCEGVD